MIIKLADLIGNTALALASRLGRIGLYLYESFYTLLTTPLKINKVFYHMNYIGVSSSMVVALIGVTGGAVLALQSHIGLARFGGERFIGPVIFLSMTRELGPVFTAIMVIGRAGSAITAEIGSMRITEQLDALHTLCINIHQYLIVPRILAGTIILPFLSILCSMCGIAAGYTVAVYILKINPEVFLEAIRESAEISDITIGLFKASVFGFLLTLISTYRGYMTSGGSKGVGVATTQSVVFSNVTIFIANYILTSLLF